MEEKKMDTHSKTFFLSWLLNISIKNRINTYSLGLVKLAQNNFGYQFSKKCEFDFLQRSSNHHKS